MKRYVANSRSRNPQPCGEDNNYFRDVVVRCKSSKEVVGYGEAAVIFVISRVGSDTFAKDFLAGLNRSKELRDWVYCSMKRLDEDAPVMQRAQIVGEAQGDKEYAKKVSILDIVQNPFSAEISACRILD